VPVSPTGFSLSFHERGAIRARLLVAMPLVACAVATATGVGRAATAPRLPRPRLWALSPRLLRHRTAIPEARASRPAARRPERRATQAVRTTAGSERVRAHIRGLRRLGSRRAYVARSATGMRRTLRRDRRNGRRPLGAPGARDPPSAGVVRIRA